MSKRRWGIKLGPPIVAGMSVVVAGVLAGCYGAQPGTSPGSSGAPESAAPGISAGPTQGAARRHGLAGATWMAEGPRGWEAGHIGGRRIALGKNEIGIAAHDRWILSAVLRPIGSSQLLIRDGAGAGSEPKTIDLGSLAPTAAVIVGDRAYVSGFSLTQSADPGILEIDLATGTARVLLPPSDAVGSRYLAASPDGSTLVSSLCDLVSSPEPARCVLTVLAPADGTSTVLGDVPGGLLRATSREVAVVAPQGPEPPEWLAGIDLATGGELWRLEAAEFGPSVMTESHGLIQQRILLHGPKPALVIDAIDLRNGRSHTLYEATNAAIGSLWPALSSDDLIVVGDDATGSRALGASAEARTRVHLVPLNGGDQIDLPITLRSEQ